MAARRRAAEATRDGTRRWTIEDSDEAYGSTTDVDARSAKKSNGSEARLSYQGHVLMENRNGLVVDGRLSTCSGTGVYCQWWTLLT